MKTRIILHIDMDAFFAQIEERENPHFRGKPIVVGADPKAGKGRGVVATCNYIARKYGIHSALPISKAYQFCPKAIFLPPNFKLYAQTSKAIFEIVKKFSAQWQIVSLDEAFLDISFTGSFREAEKLAKKLKKEIFKKEKLTSTIGIGPNKLIAKIASSQAKPNGILVIKPAQAERFLALFSVRALPGVGPKTAQKLKMHGVRQIKDIKKLSKAKLKEIFGKMGEKLREKARGIDKSPVESKRIIKSVGKEYTFEEDTREGEIIFEIFGRIIKEVHREILAKNFQFKTITVICRFKGFETHTKSKTFKTAIHSLEFFQKEAKKLLLKFIIENPKPIRLIGARLSNLS